MVKGAIKYAKAWAIVAMATRAAMVLAVFVPVVAIVTAGGIDLSLTVQLGAA